MNNMDVRKSTTFRSSNSFVVFVFVIVDEMMLHSTGLDWTGLDWTGLDWPNVDIIILY